MSLLPGLPPASCRTRGRSRARGRAGASEPPLCFSHRSSPAGRPAPRAGPVPADGEGAPRVRPGRTPRCGGSHGPAPPPPSLRPHQSLTATRVSSASHPGKPYPGRWGRLFPLLGSPGCAAGFQLPRCRAAEREEPRRCRHCPRCNE